MKSKKAFTLIELLVVIAIIGILATISVIALQNARAKSRDAKRAGDIKQVQTALELFFNDNNRYPTATEWESGQIYSTSTAGTSTYLQVIPSAPTPNDGSCTTNQNTIRYSPAPDGSSYSISLCLGNTTGTLTPGPKCLTPGGIIDRDCSCGDSITDSRDSQVYPTVKIGGQCWLAKNINYGTLVLGVNEQTDDNTIEKYCYNDHEANPSPATVACTNGQECGGCDTNGGLYQWHEALQLPYSCDAVDCTALPTDPCCNFATPIQGVCPTGWHVPTSVEFHILESYLTDVGQTCDANRSNVYDCSSAGSKMKEAGADHWSTATSTNSSGLTVLGSGFRALNGTFGNQGAYASLWALSINGANSWRQVLYHNSYSISRVSSGRGNGSSVRCLRD